MKKFYPLILITLFLFGLNGIYAIEGASSKEAPWWSTGGNCPDIPITEYHAECKAVCPQGFWLLKDIDPNTGIYVCRSKSLMVGLNYWDCVYINPFCGKEGAKISLEDNPISKFLSKHSLTDIGLRLATLDPQLFKEAKENLALQKYNLPFFVEAFHFLTPIFENLALIMFQLALFFFVAHALFRRTVNYLSGSRYAFDRPLADTIARGIFIFLLFALPVSSTANLKNEPAPVPLAVNVVRDVILDMNNLATWIAGKLTLLYGKGIFENALIGIDTLNKYLQVKEQVVKKEIQRLSTKFQKECIEPYAKYNGIDNPKNITFIISDEELKGIKFGTNNDYQHALYCRSLEMKLKGLVEVFKFYTSQQQALINLRDEIKKKEDKMLEILKKEINKLINQMGFLASSILIPELYLVVNQQISEIIGKSTKGIPIYKWGIEKTSLKNSLDEKFKGLSSILPASFIIAIPPFNELFFTLKKLIEAGIHIAIDPIKNLLGLITFIPFIGGWIAGFLMETLGYFVGLLANASSTILAFVITLFIATMLFPFLIIVAIMIATAIRFIFLLKDLAIFVWSMPFNIMLIFTSTSDDALKRFIEDVVRYSLTIVLIAISPVFGILLMIFSHLVLFGILGIGLEHLIQTSNIVVKTFIYVLSALIYVAGEIFTAYFALQLTFKAPDYFLNKLQIGIGVLGQTAQEFYSRFSSTIFPRL